MNAHASIDRTAGTAAANTEADAPADAVSDGAGTAASANGIGSADAAAAIDDQTAHSSRSVNPSASSHR